VTRSIGSILPTALVEFLDGSALDIKVGEAFHCITVSADGWPYLALISVGELLVTEPSRMRLAVWATSTTTSNLQRAGRCTLALIHEQTSYAVRCLATPAGAISQPDGPPLSVFDLSIVDVLEDVAPYATLESGVRYELHDTEAVIARWERTISSLRRGL
jgi:hypothetical protein